MRGKFLLPLLLLLLGSSFFIFNTVFSANSDIVINEIGAYVTNTHEWVEIWNKGTSTIDLKDWKFLEGGSKHTLSVSSTNSTVDPNEFAAIVQDEEVFKRDYPNFLGSIFDSSWGSLSETGEEIGLEDNNGNMVETCSYVTTTQFSLERKNPFWPEYSLLNWQEHTSGNTVGFINSNFSLITSTASSTPISTSTAQVDPTLQLKINEVVPDPENGEEWVELYNPTTSSINLNGLILCDNRESTSCTIASPTGTIAAQSWLVIFIQGNKLNNSGDSVILKNASGTIIDSVSYVGENIPKSGQSLSRSSDGGSEWKVTTQITPGAANVIVSPPTPANSGSSSSGYQSSPSQPSKNQSARSTAIEVVETTKAAYVPVVINEIFPNPEGVDTEKEFIELKNIVQNTVSIDDWKIKVGTKAVMLEGELAPDEIFVLSRSKSGIALKNTGEETVKLLNEKNEIVSEVIYKDVKEGESYSRTASGTFKWTPEVTEGEENEFSEQELENDEEDSEKETKKDENKEHFIWNLEIPAYAAVDQEITMSAENSLDVRGGAPEYIWIIDGSSTFYGEKIVYTFATSGIHTGKVLATTLAGTVSERDFTIDVSMDGTGGPMCVFISEVFPAPKEKTQTEFIELSNDGTEKVNVGGWKIKVGDQKQFIIPTSTFIFPGARLVFPKTITKLTLANTEIHVELADDKNNKIDELDLTDIENGKSYSLIQDKWYWGQPNPHKFLLFPPAETKKETAKKTTTTAKKATSANSKARSFSEVSLKDVPRLKKNQYVILEGTVIATPGIFSSQYFYIGSEEGGIQVYQSKKDFPELVLGDKITVQGKISESAGAKRILLENKEAIDILDTGTEPEAKKSSIKNLKQINPGSLVYAEGEITEIKGTYMYIDDGEAEVVVDFKKGAAIDKGILKEGTMAAVTGVLEQTKDGLHIWPRSQDDINKFQKNEVKPVEPTTTTQVQNSIAEPHKFTLLIIVGAILLAAGFFVRMRKS